MKVDVLLGLQWGDEGKGKIVDYLAPKYDLIARFQGGPNAGHTLEFDGIKHVLHQIPSGIFHPEIQNLIGNGVVLDPVILKEEVKKLEKYSIDATKNLFVSRKAQLIIPTHRLLDAAFENSKGLKKIGSTLKGIGPAYQDKIARLGLRVGDVLKPDFDKKYQDLVLKHIETLNNLNYQFDLVDLEYQFFKAIEYLKNLQTVDGEFFINDAAMDGKKILAEGAQGSLLDVDFGSYPFVTSSNTVAAGAATGLGIAPNMIGEVFGIFKAYCTRVGSGPFPTELFDATGQQMQNQGHEFGATTGRPRRCGWLDLPALKYTIMINGVTQLFMTKADVLNNFERINICTNYDLGHGTIVDRMPYDINDLEIDPVYQTIQGWNQPLTEVQEFETLPVALMDYITYLETQLQVPITIISTGPDRTQTLIKNLIQA